MSQISDLDILRGKVRETDKKILELIAERMELAKAVGKLKDELSLPIKDFAVEKQVIENARLQAKTLNLPLQLAEDVLSIAIKYSVMAQDKQRNTKLAPADAPQPKALVIGGNGKMGRWFVQYYESLGFSLSVLDPQDSDHQIHPNLKEISAEILHFDIIVVATPLSKTAAILEKVIALRPQGLIIEICSLKSPIFDLIIEGAAKGLKIASIHPMFGSESDSLVGKNILFCRAQGLASSEVKMTHFQKTSAKLIEIDLHDHDRIISYVLGSSHLINLLFASILLESAEPLPKLNELGGTTFMNQIEVTKHVVNENQDLYYEIQRMNAATPKLLNDFQKKLDDFRNAIENGDRDAFIELMLQGSRYFNSSKK